MNATPLRPFTEIVKGFPDPGPRPQSRRALAVVEHEWAHYAHRAVHDNDPVYRDYMIGMILRCLASGAPIGSAGVEWMIFVLATLQREEVVPHLAIGRPVDRYKKLEARGALRAFMLSHLDQPLKEALAASGMSKAEHVYYSDEFALDRLVIEAARNELKVARSKPTKKKSALRKSPQ